MISLQQPVSWITHQGTCRPAKHVCPGHRLFVADATHSLTKLNCFSPSTTLFLCSRLKPKYLNCESRWSMYHHMWNRLNFWQMNHSQAAVADMPSTSLSVNRCCISRRATLLFDLEVCSASSDIGSSTIRLRLKSKVEQLSDAISAMPSCSSPPSQGKLASGSVLDYRGLSNRILYAQDVVTDCSHGQTGRGLANIA